MTFSALLLGAAGALLGYLAVTGGAMVAIGGLTLFGRWPARGPTSARPRGAVAVLMPAHNEGEGVVDALEAVLHQDYEGMVRVYVLVADEDDGAAAALRDAYPPRREKGQIVLKRSRKREVVLVPRGATAKRDKLNAILPELSEPFVAFLDADHRAAPDWLSSALTVMEREGAAAVQSRRRPLAVTSLPQVWDSVQNHLGNEAVNAAVTSLRGSVAFTGTTSVFRAEALRDRRFADCITEDTYLTFELAVTGVRVAYDPASGSYEEVAPTLRSFIARRRRWSAGRTHAFLGHLRRIVGAPLSLPRKLHLLVFGQVFLTPVAVAALNLVLAAYWLLQLPRGLVALIGGGVALAGAGLATLTRSRGRAWVSDALVGALWALPFVTLLGVLAYRASGDEGYHYLLSFPHARTLAGIQVALALAPVAMTLAAAPRIRGAGPGTLLAFLATYPLMLVLDVYACLLGTADLALRRALLDTDRRRNAVSAGAVPASLRRHLTRAGTARARLAPLAWLVAAGVLVLAANEVLAVNDCGEVRPFLWQPWLGGRSHPAALELDVEQSAAGDGTLALAIRARAVLSGGVHAEGGAPPVLALSLDGRELASRPADAPDVGLTHVERVPLGFATRTVTAKLSGGLSCRRDRRVSTAFVETRGQELWLNGEPFLLKGVVGSWAAPRGRRAPGWMRTRPWRSCKPWARTPCASTTSRAPRCSRPWPASGCWSPSARSVDLARHRRERVGQSPAAGRALSAPRPRNGREPVRAARQPGERAGDAPDPARADAAMEGVRVALAETAQAPRRRSPPAMRLMRRTSTIRPTFWA